MLPTALRIASRLITRGQCLKRGQFHSLKLLQQPTCSPRLLSRGFSPKYIYTSKKVSYVTPLFLKTREHGDRIAIVDQNGAHSYNRILQLTSTLCGQILEKIQQGDEPHSDNARIAILCPNDVSFIISQLATWMSGGVCVPLSKSHPPAELEYFIENSGSTLVITTEEFKDKLAPVVTKLGVESIVLERKDYSSQIESSMEPNSGVLSAEAANNASLFYDRAEQILQANKFQNMPALIIYTSGTTGRPKGVVHTYGSLQSQVEGMVTSWQWTPADVILHVLPLHHIHGIVNTLMTPLHCGATCVMLPKFDAAEVWKMLLDPVSPPIPRMINVFMAVPTIYAKLIEEFEKSEKSTNEQKLNVKKKFIEATCLSKIRLMVSGSAALPSPILEKWQELTGHTLLERYGMTETGMVLTNPLHGERRPGAVGKPFPKVEVCVARPNVYSEKSYDVLVQGTSHTTTVTPGCEDEQGELYVKGPNLFTGYWRNTKATDDTYTKDGWFKTGDTACYEDGYYKILGRTSVDIIKSGGYKLSALDIERHLLAHPDIVEVAVVGLPDITWGQRVAAVIVMRPGAEELSLQKLRDWASALLAPYQLPTSIKVLDAIPRNAMGKVNKVQLVKTVFERQANRQY